MVGQIWQASDFLQIQINPRGQWNNPYKILKERKNEPETLYMAKMSFMSKTT